MKKIILLGVIAVFLVASTGRAMADPSDKAFEKSGNFVNLFDPGDPTASEGWYIVGVKNPQSPGDMWGISDTGMVSFDKELTVSPYTVMQVYTPTGKIIRNENFMHNR